MALNKSILDKKEFLRPDEVAALLQLSMRTVYRRLREGRLSRVKVGGVWRIPSASLKPLCEK